MNPLKSHVLVGCLLLASSFRPCFAAEDEQPAAPSAAEAWLAPTHGQPANDVVRLGSRAIADVGFEQVGEFLYLGDERWLVAGRTTANKKELRLFDANDGQSTFLYELGGEFDDVPSFSLLAAPFDSHGMRPIAVLALNNFGGRCCVDNRVDLVMALLDSDGKLHSARKVVGAKTGYLIDRYSTEIKGPLPFDESEIVEEARVFFLRSKAPSGPAFVLWQKQCQGNNQPLADHSASGSPGPCGRGMSLARDSLTRFSIDAASAAIRAAQSVDDAATPPPTFWRALPFGTWTDHEIGVSEQVEP